jgi:transcriptional regulator with GAF, ATPase, and Fis domain
MNDASTAPELGALISNAAAQDGEPHRLLEILAKAAGDLLNVEVITLSSFDPSTWESERLYSTRPVQYPVSGKKPVNQTRWTDWVMKQKRTFVANTTAEIAEVFFDHDDISKLGCESIINIPIVFCGSVIGTINCLGPARHFGPENVAKAEMLKLPGLLAFLALKARHAFVDT